MKRIFLLSMLMAGLLISTLTTAASKISVQEPMGGKTFGHSVKNIGDGL